MIIKIISATEKISTNGNKLPKTWYNKHLNKFFNVEPYNNNDTKEYYIIKDGKYINHYIRISDTISLTSIRLQKLNSL